MATADRTTAQGDLAAFAAQSEDMLLGAPPQDHT